MLLRIPRLGIPWEQLRNSILKGIAGAVEENWARRNAIDEHNHKVAALLLLKLLWTSRK